MRPDSENYVIKRSKFNHFRNTLKKTMIHAKRFYYKNMFDRFKHDMKKEIESQFGLGTFNE